MYGTTELSEISTSPIFIFGRYDKLYIYMRLDAPFPSGPIPLHLCVCKCCRNRNMADKNLVLSMHCHAFYATFCVILVAIFIASYKLDGTSFGHNISFYCILYGLWLFRSVLDLSDAYIF